MMYLLIWNQTSFLTPLTAPQWSRLSQGKLSASAGRDQRGSTLLSVGSLCLCDANFNFFCPQYCTKKGLIKKNSINIKHLQRNTIYSALVLDLCFLFIPRCFKPLWIPYLISTDLKTKQNPFSLCILSTWLCVLLSYIWLHRFRRLALRGPAAASGLDPVVCGGVEPEGDQLHRHLAVQRSPIRFQSADVHREDFQQTITLHWPGAAAGQR